MEMKLRLLAILLALASLPAYADTGDPWGRAEEVATQYLPANVLYDVDKGGIGVFKNILDRVSHLNKLYAAGPFESSIVVVIHGETIPLFGIRELEKYQGLMARAQSLTQSGMIEFRMCRAAAAILGYRAADMKWRRVLRGAGKIRAGIPA
jgi:intracellular sulfur oxidation DsrE/DsrF family protein